MISKKYLKNCEKMDASKNEWVCTPFHSYASDQLSAYDHRYGNAAWVEGGTELNTSYVWVEPVNMQFYHLHLE